MILLWVTNTWALVRYRMAEGRWCDHPQGAWVEDPPSGWAPALRWCLRCGYAVRRG
jgi:hypothetical protein